jgi:hypothetical protein
MSAWSVTHSRLQAVCYHPVTTLQRPLPNLGLPLRHVDHSLISQAHLDRGCNAAGNAVCSFDVVPRMDETFSTTKTRVSSPAKVACVSQLVFLRTARKRMAHSPHKDLRFVCRHEG